MQFYKPREIFYETQDYFISKISICEISDFNLPNGKTHFKIAKSNYFYAKDSQRIMCVKNHQLIEEESVFLKYML